MTYLQAVVIALVQGVTELFPVSSLGHSELIPAWIGGSWQTLVTQSAQANSESSFYLAYIVALHCATALALFGLLIAIGDEGYRDGNPPIPALAARHTLDTRTVPAGNSASAFRVGPLAG